MRYLLTLVLGLGVFSASGQTKMWEFTEFYSNTWSSCSNSSAVYYIEYKALNGCFVKYEVTKRNKWAGTSFPTTWYEEVYAANGDLISKGAFNQGYYDGQWERYHSNGKLKSAITYAKGKELNAVTYHEDGNIKFKDKKYYYSSLALESEWIDLDDNNKVKIEYYETGAIERKIYYANDKHTIDSSFRSTGELEDVVQYKSGKTHVKELFFLNGNVSRKSVYEDYSNYTELNYTREGEIQSEKTYEAFALIINNEFSEPVDPETGEIILSSKELVFTIVEQMPSFEGCGKLKGDEMNQCTNIAIQTYISKNIIYPQVALENDIEGKEFVRFVVDETGKVTDVSSAKGTNSQLTEQAIRLVGGFPKFSPGTQRGKNVKVQYIIPINFKIG
jgi:TonB family protein